MLPYRDSRATRITLILFFIAALGYAYYEAQSVLWGPRIDIPDGLKSVTEERIIIAGQAETIQELRLNGTLVSVTENGAFEEPYLLAPGYNRIVLEARDRYGRSAEKVLEITYTPKEGERAAVSATSTERMAEEE